MVSYRWYQNWDASSQLPWPLENWCHLHYSFSVYQQLWAFLDGLSHCLIQFHLCFSFSYFSSSRHRESWMFMSPEAHGSSNHAITYCSHFASTTWKLCYCVGHICVLYLFLTISIKSLNFSCFFPQKGDKCKLTFLLWCGTHLP